MKHIVAKNKEQEPKLRNNMLIHTKNTKKQNDKKSIFLVFVDKLKLGCLAHCDVVFF